MVEKEQHEQQSTGADSGDLVVDLVVERLPEDQLLCSLELDLELLDESTSVHLVRDKRRNQD